MIRKHVECLEKAWLCPYHAWLLVDVVRRNPYLDILDPSIMYEDMLAALISRIEPESISTASPSIGSCLMYRYVGDYERIYVDELSICMKKSNLLELYANSSSILCLIHYVMVFNNKQSRDARNRLRQIQLRKLKELSRSVRELIGKQDYRAREEPSKTEALAWIRVVEVLKGYNTSTAILHGNRDIKKNSILSSLTLMLLYSELFNMLKHVFKSDNTLLIKS